MTVKIAYERVTFKSRTKLGSLSSESLSSKNGFVLTRIIDGAADSLFVASKGKPSWEVPWHQVASAQRSAEPPKPAPKAKLAKEPAQ